MITRDCLALIETKAKHLQTESQSSDLGQVTNTEESRVPVRSPVAGSTRE